METIVLICALTSTLALLVIIFFINYSLRVLDKKRVEQQSFIEQKQKELVAGIKRMEDSLKVISDMNQALGKEENQLLGSIVEQVKQSQSALTEEIKTLRKSIEKLDGNNAKGFEELRKCLEDVVKL